MVAARRRGRRQDAAHRRWWAAQAAPGHRTAEADLAGGGGEHTVEKSLLYVALGDSAGVGLGVDDPARSYVALVAARYAQTTGQPVRTVNLAVSGATIGSVVAEQLPRLAQLPAPGLVTCIVGGNDVAWPVRFRPAAAEEDVRRLAAGLPRGAVLGLVPSFGHWPYEGRARRLNRVLRCAAQQRGLRVADLWETTRARWPWRTLGLLGPDLFHPGVEGHRLWAETVWAAFQRDR